MDFARTLKATELRSEPIYRGISIRYGTGELHELLGDPTLDLSLKFTAVLSVYAFLTRMFDRPLRLSDFRDPIPDDFWREHFHFGYCKYGGWQPIYHESGEGDYSLGIGNGRSHLYGAYSLRLVSRNVSRYFGEEIGGYFDPPLDLEVVRFTICHPFLQPELHDGAAVRLFKCN